MSDLVERVARAMAEEKLWLGVWERMPDAEREEFRIMAFAAIKPVLKEAIDVCEGISKSEEEFHVEHGGLSSLGACNGAHWCAEALYELMEGDGT